MLYAVSKPRDCCSQSTAVYNTGPRSPLVPPANSNFEGPNLITPPHDANNHILNIQEIIGRYQHRSCIGYSGPAILSSNESRAHLGYCLDGTLSTTAKWRLRCRHERSPFSSIKRANSASNGFWSLSRQVSGQPLLRNRKAAAREVASNFNAQQPGPNHILWSADKGSL